MSKPPLVKVGPGWFADLGAVVVLYMDGRSVVGAPEDARRLAADLMDAADQAELLATGDGPG